MKLINIFILVKCNSERLSDLTLAEFEYVRRGESK